MTADKPAASDPQHTIPILSGNEHISSGCGCPACVCDLILHSESFRLVGDCRNQQTTANRDQSGVPLGDDWEKRQGCLLSISQTTLRKHSGKSERIIG